MAPAVPPNVDLIEKHAQSELMQRKLPLVLALACEPQREASNFVGLAVTSSLPIDHRLGRV